MKNNNIEYVSKEELTKACYEFYNPRCCSGRAYDVEDMLQNAVGICKECGCPVDEDGEALEGCRYSTETCKVCGYRACDGSC